MTFREQAERIVFEARHLDYEAAVQLVEAKLALLRVEGEKAGIEEARQAISQIGPAPIVQMEAAE